MGDGRRQVRVSRCALAVALAATMLAACGEKSGLPVLSWYINPDDGGQAELARRCTDAAGSRYRITTSLCPMTPAPSESSFSAAWLPRTRPSTS
jgi:multiple sugar transport system substrate-binding protein